MSVNLSIAGFVFEFSGPDLCAFVKAMPFFRPFLTGDDAGVPELRVSEELDGAAVAGLEKMCREKDSFFDLAFEDIVCRFYRDWDDIIFRMDEEHSGLELWEVWTIGGDIVRTSLVHATATMYRYALWTAVNFLTLKHNCLAIHCSANVFDDEAVIYLGESGTGKSTHTRLLRERYPESFLLNDDSPFVRVTPGGEVLVFGSPWSGKTPCYRQEAHPLKAIVRLRQAPYNKIRKLDAMQAIGALLPSAPPALNYTDETADMLCNYVSDILDAVPAWILECLPDTEAAELSHDTVL